MTLASPSRIQPVALQRWMSGAPLQLPSPLARGWMSPIRQSVRLFAQQLAPRPAS
jgi:hypothetical protein